MGRAGGPRPSGPRAWAVNMLLRPWRRGQPAAVTYSRAAVTYSRAAVTYSRAATSPPVAREAARAHGVARGADALRRGAAAGWDTR